MTVTQYDKTTLRAALRIQAAIARAFQNQGQAELPLQQWRDLERLHHRLGRASSRGWHAAGRRLIAQFLSRGEQFQWRMTGFLAELRRQDCSSRPPAALDIYRDIMALEHEFEEVGIDIANHELCVTTEPIELEGIYLGPFQVRLDWQAIVHHAPYRVVALNPNPAATNKDVTHPHVQDGRLCEGEGKAAIRAALAEGRLFDFFVLVVQILRTYGLGRAFVELERWEGVTCHDCGTSVHEDDARDCERCEDILCEDCCWSCPRCGRQCCSQCTAACGSCEQRYCKTCLKTCSGCGGRICPRCLNNDLCEECYEKREEQRQRAEPCIVVDDGGNSGGANESEVEPEPALELTTCS